MKRRIMAFLCALAMVTTMVDAAVFASVTNVAATNGTEKYSSLQAAVDDHTSGVIILEEDAQDITVTHDVYLDLNGHDIAGVTVTGGTLYCMDSQTNDYTVADGVYGKLTGVTGSVAAVPVEASCAQNGYLMVTEDDGVSFHCVNLQIYAMTLRPSNAGVYYRSYFAGDEIVAGRVQSFGVALSVAGAPTAENMDTLCRYSAFTGFAAGKESNSGSTNGTLLTGIMSADNTDDINRRNANMAVYGAAYIRTADGLMLGNTVSRNLQTQVEAIDGAWSSLTATQSKALLTMYETYESVMSTWDVPNIRAAFEDPTGEENTVATVTVPVTAENGVVTEAVTVESNGVSVTIPFGALLEAGASELTLTVTQKQSSDSGIEAEAGQTLMPFDVHVEGISAENTVPLTVALGEVMPENLNMGNYTVYHVEESGTNAMELVANDAEFTAHNQFKYTLDGELTLHMATFSEVAVVSDVDNSWKGTRNYEWYDADAKELTIRNADQLAGFGAIVGGMDGQTQDSFSGKTIKLLADINIGDLDSENGIVFYPIGYYSSDGKYEKTREAITSGFYTFEGTFDGNGNTISNIYQNTWEMKGDHNWYDATLQYYRDGMGLFGKVYGGTVKNLTVDNFSSDGEITTTGVIAAYADCGATFENIAITNCNPRVYNIGNGGIVGCVGWYANDARTGAVTFRNITVDNSNKISALWGSYDVACGGLVGQYYPTSGQTNAIDNGGIHMENCHVSAQIDVYNDVCANYQYYAYRYAGMLIGSIRENVTGEDGNVYPNMDGITATGCTVHFGTWNDYYYCEIIDNTTASYTHDYQMSRLVEIKSIDGTTVTYLDDTTGTVPATGRANYVIVDYTKGHGTDNATCYHFKDGVVWTHDMGGYETTDIDGDGNVDSDVLKEDKQHIYLEFNNLVTGYGWGVTSKGVDDLEGVTILDRVEANSVEKFEKAVTAKESYTTGTTVTIGELFKAATIEDTKLSIKPENVQVTVSPVDKVENGETVVSTAGGTYTANTTDWTQGTLTFSGLGAAAVTITDYYFCIPTTVNVTVTEPDSVDKFDLVFENTDDYLYRAGNANTVALGSLFKAKDGAEIGNVTVTVTALNGATVSGTYTAYGTDWTKGTIQFSGTGPVSVTIGDDAYANEKTLYLEVVNATNVTDYSGLGNKNSVLLNDITMSSGSSYYLSGATLYGNGFTFDVTAGAYSGTGSVSNNYLICLSNAALDNVEIVGKVYTEYGAQVANDYNRPAVLSTGNNTIANCYISNCAAPVRVKDGNLEIINTTLKGGNFANLDIRNGHVVLDNVTTINQVKGNDTAEDDTIVVGLGVVVYYEKVLNTTTIEIKNGITQCNYLSKTQAETYIADDTAKELVSAMFDSEYSNLQYSDGSDTWVNTGILSMTEEVGDDNITDVDGYVDASPSMTGVTGYLHTKKPDATSIAATAPAYKTVGQYAIAPSYSFDYTTKNYAAKTDGSNDYCYEENGTVYISMDAGDTFNWDTSILTATKNGQTLSYTVSMNGTDYTGKSIAFNTAGNYEVVYTYTDSSNYGVDENGNITTYSKTYTKTVHISVAVIEASAKQAEFTMGSSNAATEKITVDNVTYVSATGVTADNSTWTYMTVGDQKIYYPIVAAKLTATSGSKSYAYFPVFENVVTITDYADSGTGDAFTYNSSTTTLPSTLTAVKGVYKAASDVTSWSNLTNSNLTQSGASKIFKWASSSDAPSDPTTYNSVLCYKSPEVSADRVAYITLVQYSYTDATNTTYYYYVGYTLEAFDQSSCITPDTLVTLADGTQKEIQYVTYEDQLLVWDFVNGCYTTAPASIIENHGYDMNVVIKLTFADGTVVKAVNVHGFFSADLNKWVDITAENAQSYIGSNFVQVNGDSYKTVQLVEAVVTVEYMEAWSILTADHYNCIMEDMFAITPPATEQLAVFEIGENLTYDAEKMQADIETYGLYTYEEFAHLMTREAFDAFKIAYTKIAVGKGLITNEEIVALIQLYA